MWLEVKLRIFGSMNFLRWRKASIRISFHCSGLCWGLNGPSEAVHCDCSALGGDVLNSAPMVCKLNSGQSRWNDVIDGYLPLYLPCLIELSPFRVSAVFQCGIHCTEPPMCDNAVLHRRLFGCIVFFNINVKRLFTIVISTYVYYFISLPELEIPCKFSISIKFAQK